MKVAVLGAGSWGTTLASLLSDRQETVVWAREPDLAAAISCRHENAQFLSGFPLPESLGASNDIEEVVAGAAVVVFAVPSRYFRSVVELARPHVGERADLVSVTKGIEPLTCMRMTQVLQEVLECGANRVCVLAGPNLAREVMAGHPSATVVACHDDTRAQLVQRLFMSDSLRVYTNPDVVGCEIGGAVKNVIAIAAGISDGLGYGWNTKAALIARGLAELARLGVALGGAPLTFLGLAGNGDLTATCSSPQSRNRGVGEQLGKGRALPEILAAMHMVAEGVGSTPGVLALSEGVGVDMPICRGVGDVLDGTIASADLVARLMHREPGPELHDLGV